VTAAAVPGDGLLPPGAYGREDEAPDPLFYELPRRVVHIDDGAIAALGRLYGEALPMGGRLLDLMSSWRSHLPPGLRAAEIVGLGLNADEMADNPQLTRHVVHDLNRQPRLPFEAESFDGAMCAVSIQYLVHPLEVFREVRRVLRPGAPFVVAFSNRCFPTKAVAVWHATSDAQHVALVRAYFESAGGWQAPVAEDRSPAQGDPLHAVWARTKEEP
jgi:SAM-dependent methyltransferase